MNTRAPSDRAQLGPGLAWATYLLASPWGPDETLPAPAGPADPAEVVKLLRRNGVPLLTLAADPRPAARALLAAAPFAAALAEDAANLARQQAAFAEIQAAWAVAGIPALFVKALGPAPTFPYVSGNLDVAVPRPQQDAARKVVRGLGYVELRHIEEPNKFLLRRHHLGEIAFDIHIHGRVEWHTEFLDTPAVWQRSGFASDCRLAAVPALEDGILIALAHALYENKALKLIELAKVMYAARRPAVDWSRVIAGAQARGWLPGLWFALALCDRWEAQLYGTASLPAALRAQAEAGLVSWQRNYIDAVFAGAARAPVRLSFLRSKQLFYAKMLADPTLAAAERARLIVVHTVYGTRLRLGIRSQRPMLVALDGIDGSGKSAQAELLAHAVAGAPARQRLVWTRGGSAGLLQPLFRLGKRVLRPRAVANGSAAPGAPTARESERATLFRQPVVRAVWPWLIALELGFVYQWRVRWPLLRGDVVIADRYVLSALTDLAARLDRPDIAHSAPGRLLRGLAPRPAHSFWFEVPVEVALARKGGEESGEMLRRQAAVAPALAAELGATRLDATLPLADLSDPLVTQVLRHYFDAHWTLINALVFSNPRPLPANWQEDTAL